MVYVGNVTLQDFDWLPEAAKPLPHDRAILQSLLRKVDSLVESSQNANSRLLSRIDAWRHGLDGGKDVALQALDQLSVLDLVHDRVDADPDAELLRYVDVAAFREALLDLELACWMCRNRRPSHIYVKAGDELDRIVAERLQGIFDACDGIRAVYRRLRAEIIERLSQPDGDDDTAVQMSVPQMAAYICGERLHKPAPKRQRLARFETQTVAAMDCQRTAEGKQDWDQGRLQCSSGGFEGFAGAEDRRITHCSTAARRSKGRFQRCGLGRIRLSAALFRRGRQSPAQMVKRSLYLS